MFTGIVERTGEIREVKAQGNNLSFWITSSISSELKADQSVSHDGVCLTIEKSSSEGHQVTAVFETLQKTTLSKWGPGKKVNLERSVSLSQRLDGHLVQGHVDSIATCLEVDDQQGSYQFTFKYDERFASLIIEKGSICINGISLTAFDVQQTTFKIAVIPYTWNQTNISAVKPGDSVNVEFDLIGKYILRRAMLSSNY